MPAGKRIIAQLDEMRIELNRFLGFRQRRLQFGEFGVRRQSFRSAGDGLTALPKFSIDRPVIVQNRGGLLGFALASGSARGLNDVFGHAEIERIVTSGEGKAKATEAMRLVIMLL